MSDEQLLDDLQKQLFDYFTQYYNDETGLVADNNTANAPASIAVVGMALSAYIIGVERGYMRKADAVNKTLTVLRFLSGTGHQGFFYHFLDMHSGERFGNCELSTIDTALLMAGVLSVAAYFDEPEVQALANALFNGVNWQWALCKKDSISHGWRPGKGFLHYRWNKGYSEALLLYILAMGSTTFGIDASCYQTWTTTFEWVKHYDMEYIYAGPLFIHQLPQLWLDLRGRQDSYTAGKSIDYFENSRRATVVQQQYAIDNPKGFMGYDVNNWGLSACEGPGPSVRKLNDKKIKLFDYKARGVPHGPDDGTLSPLATAASLPFAPGIILNFLRHHTNYANKNPTTGWVSNRKFGLQYGAALLAIENYRSGLLWNVMQKCGPVQRGLTIGGFQNV